jgi:serine phosphatase RsbU (regulator of sigma subunit)
MIYAQLAAHQPLADIVSTANRYICEKGIGKYATMIILRLGSDGQMEFINCGHIPPVVCVGGELLRLTDSNVPVGLLQDGTFQASTVQLAPGTRVVAVTDGVTEAHDAADEFFDEMRLENAVRQNATLDEILSQLHDFAGSLAADDDCTIVEVRYTGG